MLISAEPKNTKGNLREGTRGRGKTDRERETVRERGRGRGSR